MLALLLSWMPMSSECWDYAEKVRPDILAFHLCEVGVEAVAWGCLHRYFQTLPERKREVKSIHFPNNHVKIYNANTKTEACNSVTYMYINYKLPKLPNIRIFLESAGWNSTSCLFKSIKWPMFTFSDKKSPRRFFPTCVTVFLDLFWKVGVSF